MKKLSTLDDECGTGAPMPPWFEYLVGVLGSAILLGAIWAAVEIVR